MALTGIESPSFAVLQSAADITSGRSLNRIVAGCAAD
jgi:hypothetical protein